ncbi:MAG: T9SS type A sorting domain-containing protein [Bacteroidetes bacterium]|nr:T9SS type A sorting domain-containing protein [Bacteroidota bacterium]
MRLNTGVPLSLNIRNELFGAVVADSARYDENYQSGFRYNGKVITYKVLKSDTSLIDMDDESDASFIDFYYSMKQSNLEKYDSIAVLISQREYSNAAAILAGINDTNEQEEYLSAFYNLYLTKIVFDSTLSAQDSSFLLDMAYSHSLLYGDAVYLARNVLFLEIHDVTLESNLRRAVFSKQLDEIKLLIQPNPASVYSQIRLNDELFSGRIQLFDVNSNLSMDKVIINGFLDVKSLLQGIYFVKVYGAEGSLSQCKLVIIR